MRKKILFFLISIAALSCNKTTETDDFSIFIPSDLKETTEILENTELQFANDNLYLAVEKMEDNMPLDTFCKENIYSLFDFINNIDSESLKTKYGTGKIINFNEGIYSDKYEWMVKVLPKNNLYYILWVWTPETEFENNSSKMKKIIKSFKLK